MGVRSSVLALLTVTDPTHSYWTCTLSSGRVITERDVIFGMLHGGLRPIDWSLDVVSTGDIYKIREVSLHCPDGRIATHTIEEPGTCFQLKIASLGTMSGRRTVQSHLIGKVTDKESGLCDCYIWDRQLGLIVFHSSVYACGSWRAGVLPLGCLSADVLGLRL
jgi:hypothetical protein